jgi:hypothetical protein
MAESAMSHLVNQRMGKRQPMRWSAAGTHLLLQARCAVLNNRLDSWFREWHPDFRMLAPSRFSFFLAFEFVSWLKLNDFQPDR